VQVALGIAAEDGVARDGADFGIKEMGDEARNRFPLDLKLRAFIP